MTPRRKRALRHEPTVKELFEDGRAIDDALLAAARDARRLHKALGNPDGHVEGRAGRMGSARGHPGG